jgi:hypothetical protein
MTTTMDNLEKLIQMATIEHMYSMLQKMKTETSTNFKECNFSDETYSAQNNALIGSLLNEMKHLKTETNDHTEKLRRNNSEYWQLSQTIQSLQVRIQQLETELNEIKSNTNNNSKFLCQQIRGQQKLTSYPGFSNGTQDEAHIKLKIEEKIVEAHCEADIESNNSDEDENTNQNIGAEIEEYEYEDEENDGEDINPAMITCSTITLDIKPPNTLEQPEKDVAEEESEEEESEEEVTTEDETEVLSKEAETVREYIKEKDKEVEEAEEDEELSVGEELGEHVEPVVKHEEEAEEEEAEEEEAEEEEAEEEEAEEEEEVFEIEIDDVTYFATGEENGILYEMTSDGDIGKKVGIIKDGEPIFN